MSSIGIGSMITICVSANRQRGIVSGGIPRSAMPPGTPVPFLEIEMAGDCAMMRLSENCLRSVGNGNPGFTVPGF